jgi:glycerophosphoryl diester phosphodiesterase
MAKISLDGLRLPEGFTVTAHAGAMSLPDNSLISLNQAIKAGANVVEMDVTFRPDGTPVMIHKEIAKQNEGVSLDKAFGIVAENYRVKINLDVKSLSNLSAVQALALEHGLIERVFFTGVGEESIEQVKAKCPQIPYYLNFSPNKKLFNSKEYAQTLAKKLIGLGCMGLNCGYGEISKTLVEVLHENGLLVSVWTVDKKKDMCRMLSLSVDNITSRNPDELMAVISSMKK